MAHWATLVAFFVSFLFSVIRFAVGELDKRRPADFPDPTIPYTGRPDDTSEITKDWTGE